MGFTEPAAGVRARVEAAFAETRTFVQEFRPDLVVLFAPDHYNGFFYENMPPFCIGTAASAIGDYETPAGSLSVDAGAARALARGVLAEDVDIALSERMTVDHGFAQPLELLFGGLDRVPLVPVFVNCVAEPLAPPRSARRLGRAVGRAARTLGRRVLFLGSGGLSHDPPLPALAGASPEIAAQLISEGRVRTPAERAARQERTIQAGRDLAAGRPSIQPLNPAWDRDLLALLAGGELVAIDGLTTQWFTEHGGHSAHEARTAIAAYAALAESGPYRVTNSFYEPIPQWVAGFAITAALPIQEK